VLSPRNRPCSPPPPRGWRPCSWSAQSPAVPRLSLPSNLRYFRNGSEHKFLFIFFDQKLQFIYVQPTAEAFNSLQKRTSSTLKIKFINFFLVYGSFLPSWNRIRFANLDQDPGTTLNLDPIRIHSTGSYSFPALFLILNYCT
jgi:hypothetical protein